MSILWIPVTLLAAAAQTARNATQSSLIKELGTIGATQVRFLYGLPFAILFLCVLILFANEPISLPNGAAFGFTVLGACAQILATALMLAAMRERSFAVATALTKTEPVLVAVFGLIVLGDTLTFLKVIAILTATAGVIVISWRPGQTMELALGDRGVRLGLAAAGCFGLSAIGYRGAILSLTTGSFYVRATTILVAALVVQVLLLVGYMLLRDRGALTASLRVWRVSLTAGFLGALASQCWFLGFSLTSAANVRTLALVEVIMAQTVSRRLFSQEIARQEVAGMVLVVVGVAILLWAAT
jgi:drug/metabolite transporter (DMT)-like permease